GKGTETRMSEDDTSGVLMHGAAWAVRMGYGTEADLDTIESGGAVPGADPSKVSTYARKRGIGQLGTLGSGNHFLEVQVVSAVYDEQAAEAFGLELNQV